MSVLKMKRQLAKIGICKITKDQEDSLDKAEYEDTLLPLTEKLKNDLLATPKADASRLQALRGAGQDAKIPNYANACKKLAAKDVRKIYAEELANAKGGSKEALKEAEYKAKYQKKRSTTEEQLAYLETLPGTEAVLAQIQQKLLNAASLAETSPTQYEKACGQLDNSSKLATDAAKIADKAVDALKGSNEPGFAKVKEAMGQLEALLEEIDPKIPAEESQKYWVEYTQLLDGVCKTGKKGKPAATPQECTTFVQKTGPLKQKLERRRDEMNDWADKYAEEVRKLNTKLLAMTPFVTEMFLAPFHERLKQAETLRVQQRVDQAFALIKDDMAELREKTDLWEPARNLWTKQLFDIAEPIKNGVAKMKNCPATTQEAIDCNNELDRLTAMASEEKEDSYALASAAVVELKKSVDKHLETVTAYTNNRQSCTDADREVQSAILHAQTQLTAAQKKIVAAGGPGDAQVGESNQLLADIKTAWDRDVKVAVSVDDLEKAGTLQALADLAGELQRLASAPVNDPGLKVLVADAKTTVDKKAYETALAGVDNLLEECREYGGVTYDTLVKQVRKLQGEVPNVKTYTAAAQALIDLRLRSATLKASLVRGREEKVQEAQALLDKNRKDVLALKKKHDSKFKGLFQARLTELDDLEGMIKSTSLDAVIDAIAELKAFETRLGDLTKKLNEKGKGAENFKAVEGKITEVADALGDDTLKKFRVKQVAALTEKYTAACKGARSTDPTAALKLLGELATTIEAVQNEADQAATWFDLLHDGKSNITKDLPKLAGAKEYVASVKKRLKDLEGEFAAAQNLEKERAVIYEKLNTLLNEVAEAVKDPVKRQEKETEVRKAKADKLEAAATFKGEMAVFKAGLYKEAVALGSRGDKSAVKDLEARTKEAQKMADSEDFEKAYQQLASAKNLAEQIKANPQGFKATARGNLKAMKKVWSDGVTAFNNSLDTVADQISSEATGNVPNEVITGATTEVGRLKALFNPNVFDKCIKVLQNKDEPLAGRRAAREDGIRLCGQYLQQVQNDPLIVALSVKSPFTRISSSALYQALVNIDLNIRRCI